MQFCDSRDWQSTVLTWSKHGPGIALKRDTQSFNPYTQLTQFANANF